MYLAAQIDDISPCEEILYPWIFRLLQTAGSLTRQRNLYRARNHRRQAMEISRGKHAYNSLRIKLLSQYEVVIAFFRWRKDVDAMLYAGQALCLYQLAKLVVGHMRQQIFLSPCFYISIQYRHILTSCCKLTFSVLIIPCSTIKIHDNFSMYFYSRFFFPPHPRPPIPQNRGALSSFTSPSAAP